MGERFDFVIFGSGFGGSILSMILRQLGHSVLLLERGRHPRFVIGESSTPFANLLLERIADEFGLPFLRCFSEWGSWQKHFPQVACGLKRGFTFYHHTERQAADFDNAAKRLLVAASPNDEVADTHWYRPEFDQFLVAKAQELGVRYVDNAEVQSCEIDGCWRMRVREEGEFHADFAFDATGASGFLAERVNVAKVDAWPKTRAVFAHFRGVERLNSASSPYPADDAAVHHVFADGWIWVLRFNNGITSAGAALKEEALTRKPPEVIWRELIGRFPTIEKQFARAELASQFFFLPRIAHRRGGVIGPKSALLPSTAGFVDPLLSTGFALNLLGILRLGRYFKTKGVSGLEEYERLTLSELDATAELIGALYAKMDSFEEFAAVSLLYFAALSFTETAWRLGKEERASQFLLGNDPRFVEVRRAFCQPGVRIRGEEIARAIEPWDVAGLGDLSRANLYPVRFEDLIRNKAKVDASDAELRELFARLGVSANCFANLSQ